MSWPSFALISGLFSASVGSLNLFNCIHTCNMCNICIYAWSLKYTQLLPSPLCFHATTICTQSLLLALCSGILLAKNHMGCRNWTKVGHIYGKCPICYPVSPVPIYTSSIFLNTTFNTIILWYSYWVRDRCVYMASAVNFWFICLPITVSEMLLSLSVFSL